MAQFLDLQVTPAIREKEKISIALIGSAGSGKTAGALILAKGIIKAMYPDLDDHSQEFWNKIMVADTEHNRSKAYGGELIPLTTEYIGHFLHVPFNPPYSPERVTAVYELATQYKCDVLIFDSASPTWTSEGGVQDIQQKAGGTFREWNTIRPDENRIYDILFRDTKIHVISTIRAKTSYEMSTSETGKASVMKIGLKPEMRDNFEYEPWVTLHFDMDNNFTASNDKTGIFKARTGHITEDYGTMIYEWAEKGESTNKILEDKEAIVDKIKQYAEMYKETFMNFLKPTLTQLAQTYGTAKFSDLPTQIDLKILDKLEENYGKIDTPVVEEKQPKEEPKKLKTKTTGVTEQVNVATAITSDPLPESLETSKEESLQVNSQGPFF